MSETASISSGIAERYASAVFDLAKEGGGLATLETNLDDLAGALSTSDELSSLITSPVYTREEQGAAITAIAGKMGLSETMTNVLGLMAAKRRLFVLPNMITQLRAMIADVDD